MASAIRFTLLFTAVPVLAHDWLIVPGERVGPVTVASTEVSLRSAFGVAAVVPATIRIDKATTAPGLEIYRGRPGESLAVVWPRKEHGLWWPMLVIPCYGPAAAVCRWRTEDGIGAGLSLAELEKLNGKPFLLYPTDTRQCWSEPWWNEGKLARRLGEDVEMCFRDPGYQFNAGGAYTRSDGMPTTGCVRRIDRLLIFLLSNSHTAPANDWTIVPGERFGPIPVGAAIEPLRETLGAGQVHRVLAPADEGLGDTPGISIFGDKKGREVLLRRDGNVICRGVDGYKNCQWHLTGGIPLTGTVATFEKLNGRPFLFNGCCFDLGGIVTSWEGGTLAKFRGVRFAVLCDGLQPQRLTGDVSLRSDDPDIRKQKCSVGALDF